MEKTCSKCNISKPLEEFHKNSLGKFGVHSLCKKCYSEHKKIYYELNKIKIMMKRAEYYSKNKESFSKRQKEYRKKYPEKCRAIEQMPQRKLAKTLRSRISSAIFSGYKKTSTIDLTGCSLEFLIIYLESKFKKGMTWQNHGSGDDKWHIDHIIPCDAFDLTKEEEQRKCFHYTNLQPLWQPENLSKSNKIINY